RLPARRRADQGHPVHPGARRSGLPAHPGDRCGPTAERRADLRSDRSDLPLHGLNAGPAARNTRSIYANARYRSRQMALVPPGETDRAQVRLAELVAALSLGIDLG